MINQSAAVSTRAKIGSGTRIWHHSQVRENAVIGKNCVIGKGAYIGVGVRIGDNCKVENGAQIFRGVTVEDGAFLGPGAMCLNDRRPRAINPDGSLKEQGDWTLTNSRIGYGASIGAGSIIMPGVSVGRWAMVGSGSVVTKNVPDHGLAYGSPAKLRNFVCACGNSAGAIGSEGNSVLLECGHCARTFKIPELIYRTAV